jgi:HAD superfamily hydrolase (TIGR01549 family)
MKTPTFSIDTYKSILFDFDGVLAESSHVKTEAFAQLFTPFGEKVKEKVIQHHVEHGGISRYKKLRFYYTEYLQEEISEEKLNDIAQTYSNIVVNKVIATPWVKGVKKFLQNHHKTKELYVVSGTPQKELEYIIQKRHMEKYFRGVYGTPATKPEIIKKILTERTYAPAEVLYIGDSLSDYHDAMKADIPFLGRVPNGVNSSFPKNVQYISDFEDL